MMRTILLFILLCLTIGIKAQNLSIENDFFRKASMDSLIYLHEFGNGRYVIKDTCAETIASNYTSAGYNFDYNDENNPRRIAFDKAKKKYGIQCFNILPEDIRQKILHHAKEWPKLNLCIAFVEFDKDGKTISLSLSITGVLFESLTEEQVNRFYRTIKEVKVPFTGFFDFSEEKTLGDGGIDFLALIQEGKVSFTEKETQ